jgi:hypothetical protein
VRSLPAIALSLNRIAFGDGRAKQDAGGEDPDGLFA